MKINKLQNLLFKQSVAQLILLRNAYPNNERVQLYDYRIIGFRNSLELKIDNNQGCQCFCVFCRFDKLNELTGNLNGKHNFYSTNPVNVAICDFEDFLNECVEYLN